MPLHLSQFGQVLFGFSQRVSLQLLSTNVILQPHQLLLIANTSIKDELLIVVYLSLIPIDRENALALVALK